MASVDLLGIEGTVTAPAGCGKTHLIADALGRHQGHKPILVLTHTNAGVAALRGRLQKANVPTSAYRLSTIDGWAMRLLTLFPRRCGHDPDILKLATPRDQYPAIRETAWKMLKEGHLHDVLRASYERLIVDEYQDCSVAQHAIVYYAAKSLRTCVLGDPLQAIFGFGNNALASWSDHVCKHFPVQAELDVPWRWINAGEEEFGRYLLTVRSQLIAGTAIDLSAAPSNVQWIALNGLNDHMAKLKAGQLTIPVPDGRVLIIADSRNPQGQRDFASQIPGAVTVESVDMRDLVSFGEGLELASPFLLKHVVEFAGSVMTGVGATDMLARLESLTAGRARLRASEAEQAALNLTGSPTYAAVAHLLAVIGQQGGVRSHRPEILRGAMQLLRTCQEGEQPRDVAVRIREQSRLTGRPLARRTVGSTLLLKGLEADACVILDAEAMDRKHLYVAMTRGSRKLLVCSRAQKLTPSA